MIDATPRASAPGSGSTDGGATPPVEVARRCEDGAGVGKRALPASRTPPTPVARARKRGSGGAEAPVSYDASSDTIVLRGGGDPMTLADVARALDQPQLLRQLGRGEWLLAANLRVEEGAELGVRGPEARRLKLRSDDDGFVWLKAFGGRLQFADTCVTSWDAQAGRPDEDTSDGRSFVLARDEATMSIRRSELSYLGYDADESYGVAFRLEGTTGEVEDSVLGYNWYGLYSFEASDLVIRRNEVHHSSRYGIDPHTRSDRITIEGNTSHHNGKHGIILANKCEDGVIRDNTVYENTLHGIVIYQESDNNTVEGNRSYRNGEQGININDSEGNTIRNNEAYENKQAGIGLGKDAKDNLVVRNRIHGNGGDGVYFYSDARGNTVEGNIAERNARYGVYDKDADNEIAEGNRLSGNAKADVLREDG